MCWFKRRTFRGVIRSMTKKFSREYLTKELGLPYDCFPIEDNIIDTSRWSIIHEIIFEDGGKFYRTTYSEGATEMQWEKPWEYEEEVECEEVELREVTVNKWLPVQETVK